MKRVFLAAAALPLAVSGVSAQVVSMVPNARMDGTEGDWRRHEVVRSWRDQGGCRLSVVSYHRPDGDIQTRESRDCGKD
jgi:hypothetical protein